MPISIDDLPYGKISKLLYDNIMTAAVEWADCCAPDCESPIESLFLLAMWSRFSGTDLIRFGKSKTLEKLASVLPKANGRFICCTQVKIEQHRVDFLIAAERAGSEPPVLVAVECDGHEFHEKTKEQAARDKARDRDLVKCGVVVMRYTGAEVWRDATVCANEVVNFIAKEVIESKERLKAVDAEDGKQIVGEAAE